MFKNFVLLCIISFFVSCESKKTSSDSNTVYFTLENVEIQDLNGEKTTYPNILTPQRIIGVEKSIIIAEKKADTLLHVIDNVTLEYKYSFGKNGVGPNEIYKINTLYPSLNSSQFWIYSSETKKISLYDIEKRGFIKEHRQQSEDAIATTFAPTYRSTFIGDEADGANRYAEFSNVGEKLYGYQQPLQLENQRRDIPNSVLSYVNQGQFKANKTLEKYGRAYLYRDIIEVVNLKDSSIFTIQGPHGLELTFDIDFSAGYAMPLIDGKKSYYSYINLFLGEKYIYALYSGEVMEKVHQSNATTPHQLFQLDYKGNLIAAYNLDIAIVDLYVDEDTKTVYGLSNDENPGLVAYQL